MFFPLLPAYAQVLRRFLPARVNEADPSRPLYLDRAAQENPVVALGAAAREALRLADLLEAMLQGFRDALGRGDRRRTSEARRLADVMERLNDAIKTYLSGLDPDGLTDADHRRVAEILAFSTNLEHAGDVVDKGLLGSLARKIKRGLAFSKEGEAELLGMTDRLIANLRVAASLFVTEDVRAARMLAAEKEAFRDMEGAATTAHFERLRAGRLESDGDERAASGRAARSGAGERASGRRGRVSGAGAAGRAVAEPAAAGGGVMEHEAATAEVSAATTCWRSVIRMRRCG